MLLNYDYTASKSYCEHLGLQWLGDEWVKDADGEAFSLAFTQQQIDAAMRHHLWQVKVLFSPQNYGFKQRLLMALHFLLGK